MLSSVAQEHTTEKEEAKLLTSSYCCSNLNTTEQVIFRPDQIKYTVYPIASRSLYMFSETSNLLCLNVHWVGTFLDQLRCQGGTRLTCSAYRLTESTLWYTDDLLSNTSTMRCHEETLNYLRGTSRTVSLVCKSSNTLLLVFKLLVFKNMKVHQQMSLTGKIIFSRVERNTYVPLVIYC